MTTDQERTLTLERLGHLGGWKDWGEGGGEVPGVPPPLNPGNQLARVGL